MTGPLEAEPQTLRVQVDVSGLPAVMALARAARDVIDHADGDAADEIDWVPKRDLAALAAAVEPIYPGPAT
jgi:hypothetical protein